MKRFHWKDCTNSSLQGEVEIMSVLAAELVSRSLEIFAPLDLYWILDPAGLRDSRPIGTSVRLGLCQAMMGGSVPKLADTSECSNFWTAAMMLCCVSVGLSDCDYDCVPNCGNEL